MNKRFRTCNLDEDLLLPPSLQNWLPEKHLARFLADVTDHLDLSKIMGEYGRRDGRGMAAYHPVMLVRLLLYGYCRGVVSSRKIECATYEDVAFRYLAADQHPDHDTIAGFRQTHLLNLAGLFTQALQLCQKAGLVKLGHVAIDGTKLKANASKHKAMSYARMNEKEKQLREEVEKLLARAAAADAAEDAQYGPGNPGDDLPEELALRENRLQKIVAAKAELEQEAREHAQAKQAEVEAKLEKRRKQEEAQGKKMGGCPPQAPDPEQAKPEAKAQRNFTDPDSRIMLDGATKAFMQAYNAQAAVDSTAQIIVAAAVTQDANDKKQLAPMLEQAERNLGRKPEHATADSGYFSEAAVTDPKLEGVDLLVAPGREKHEELSEQADAVVPAAPPDPKLEGVDLLVAPSREKHEELSEQANAAVPAAPPDPEPQPSQPEAEGAQPPPARNVKETMRDKLRTPAGKAIYKMRKAVVEPVFGQIKERRGFRGFSFRGREKVAAEWQIVCLTHNLLKLFRAGLRPQSAKQARNRLKTSTAGCLGARIWRSFYHRCTLLYFLFRNSLDLPSRGRARLHRMSFISTDS